MRVVGTFLLAAIVVAGCHQEGKPIVLPPRVAPAKDVPAKLIEDDPTPTPKVGGSSIETLKDVDLSQYGLSTYPGATMDKEKNPGLKAKTKKGAELIITMETGDTARSVIEYYKAQMKDVKTAMASVSFGGLEGTSQTGNHVTVSVMNFDLKKTIVLKITI